jgi:hypothetical protein
MPTPIYIINFNRLTWVQSLTADILRIGGEPIIIDNASTYPPLLDWYATSPCRLLRLTTNDGPRSIWNLPEIRRISRTFAVTDADLDISQVPSDVLAKLEEALDRHPRAAKIGLSLEIADLPPGKPVTDYVLAHETRYWQKRLPDGLYDANVDTTFALYRPQFANLFSFSGCRMPRPYTARHLPWYEDPQSLNDESLYYLRTANRTHYSIGPTIALLESQGTRPSPLVDSLEALRAEAATPVKYIKTVLSPNGKPPFFVLSFLLTSPFWKIDTTGSDHLTLKKLF